MGPLRMVGLFIGGRRRRHWNGGGRLLVTRRKVMVKVLAENHHGRRVGAYVLAILRWSPGGGSVGLSGRQ